MAARRRITIICPARNEEAALPIFFERASAVAAAIRERYEVNFLFVNNASSDGTLGLVRGFAERHPGVYVATLSKDMGYQRAVECGLREGKGDLFLVIDADCEDPPEMLVDLLREQERGYDVVYGERVDRPEGWVMRSLRRLFYRVARAAADEEVIVDMAEFALITAEVRDAIIADANSFPFIRASIGRVGFRRLGIPYRRQPRVAGKTHYDLSRLIVFAVAGILSSSTLPLRLPIYAFPFWLAAVVALSASLAASGGAWTAALLAALVCGYLGWTLAFTSIYVARVYKNTLGRPNYVIDRALSVLPK